MQESKSSAGTNASLPVYGAAAYDDPVSRLLTLGDPRELDERRPEEARAFRELGINERHAADLIRMACDPFLNEEADLPLAWAPLHAWRVLGRLRCADAAAPLVDLLCELGDDADDWAFGELPIVLGMIGPPALPHLAAAARDRDAGHWPRILSCVALRELGRRHPEQRTAAIELLAGVLSGFGDEKPDFNGSVICELLDLKAVEAAETIERAFASGRVDEGVCGDWDEVRRVLGVPGLGIVTPESPQNSNSMREYRAMWLAMQAIDSAAGAPRPFGEVLKARRKAQGARKRRRR